MLLPLTLAMASISGDKMVDAVVWLVVIGLICWLLWWLITFIGIPEPFSKIAKALVAVVAVVLIIRMLLSFTGTHF